MTPVAMVMKIFEYKIVYNLSSILFCFVNLVAPCKLTP